MVATCLGCHSYCPLCARIGILSSWLQRDGIITSYLKYIFYMLFMLSTGSLDSALVLVANSTNWEYDFLKEVVSWWITFEFHYSQVMEMASSHTWSVNSTPVAEKLCKKISRCNIDICRCRLSPSLNIDPQNANKYLHIRLGLYVCYISCLLWKSSGARFARE